jgi:membrane AbrB-like protein
MTYAIGAAGGFAARALHLPLPMLLGSLLAVGGVAVLGLRPLGHLPQAPQKLRVLFVPIIGVAIGGAFSPAILAEAGHWWPSLLALALFIPVVHFISYRAVIATGRVDRVTAYFGTAPGGLIESVQMGEDMGADVRMLTMLQFLRLIIVIVTVPLGFTWLSGHAVGSAGGAAVPGAALTPADVAILAAAAVAGAWIGLRLKLPAGQVSGPIALSGIVHLAGLTQTVPPGWLIWVTQVVIGTSLGVRFAGMAPRHMWVALRLAVLNVTLVMIVAATVARFLSGPVGEPPAAVFLAFAPGGLVEMGLIALSLNMSIIYVTAHHVLRIVLAVTVARIFAGHLTRD